MLLVTEFTTERGEAFTVLQLLKRLRRAIIQIDRILFEHQGRIEELEIDVEEIKNNIEDIKEQLLNIINRVDTLENKVDIVEETLINIESNISNIEIILNNHGDDISALNNIVTTMSTELNELQDIVNNIPIVQPSLLNGYIKIDGVDVPVFVGGAGGAGGGGGEIIAHYESEGDVAFYGKEKTLVEFDLPNADIVNISGMISYTYDFMESITGKIIFQGGVRIYGYDEDGAETLLHLLPNNNNNVNQYKYTKNIYSCSISPTSCSSNSLAIASSQINSIVTGTTTNLSNGVNTVEYDKKIVKIKMKIYNVNGDESIPSKYYINSFDVLCSTIGGSGGNGGNGESVDNVQTFKTLGVSLHNEDNDITKNIFTMATSESYLSKYKNFKGRLRITSSGASNIKLKVNNQDFDLYPVRSDVYCIIDYTIEVETLGLVTELIVSWYNNSTRELITTESKYYYPVETSDYLTMDITADISTYGFLHVHNGELIAYPYSGELEQGD